MKPISLFALTGTLAACVVAAWLWWLNPSTLQQTSLPAAPAAGQRVPAASGGSQPAGVPVAALADGEAAPPDALLQTPEAKAWLQRQAFEQNARRFFAGAAGLDAATRVAQAKAIEADVDAYEQRRQLSAGEAMNLRLGLVQAIEADEGRRAERMAEIVTHYELDAQQREAQWQQQQNQDASFFQYKSREPIVVAEVMAMATIPGGLSRDEYLRQRLQAEREAAMR